jgi:ABC-type lipoprotein release transport system permease subunit
MRNSIWIWVTSVTGIDIKVNDVFAAQTSWCATPVKSRNSYVYISSWIGTYGYMYRDIQMIRAIMYLAMVLVIGVACFNIVSTLVMAVKDKSGDIADTAHTWGPKTVLSARYLSGTVCWRDWWAA